MSQAQTTPQPQSIPATLEIELPNNKSNDPGAYKVQLAQPITLKQGTTVSVSAAYLSLFSGAAISPANIIIEQDYEFTMTAVPTWTIMSNRSAPSTDSWLNAFAGVSVTARASPDNDDPVIINIPITIPRGSYTPQALVALFNRQTTAPTYQSSANMFTPWPLDATTSILMAGQSFNPGGTNLGPNTLAPSFVSLSQFGVQENEVETGVVQLTCVDGQPPIISRGQPDFFGGKIDNSLIYSGSSNGLSIDFDDTSGFFRIASNFTPLTSEVTGENVVVLFSYSRPQPSDTPETPIQTTVIIDRAGELLIQNWGYDEASWANSFWARLGFSYTDLYRPCTATTIDPQSLGRCYPQVNPADCLVTSDDPSGDTPTADFTALKLLQQLLPLGAAPLQNATSRAIAYDGSTVGIVASSQPILIPIPYARCVLDLIPAGEVSGAQHPERGIIGFSQPLSLINQTMGGVLSFAVYNPCMFVVRGEISISEVSVRIEDPRDGTILKWISPNPLSTVFLRCISP